MIKSKEDYLSHLRADAKNNAVKRVSPLFDWLLKYVIVGGLNPIWDFIVTMRKLEYYTNCPTFLNRIRKVFAQIRYRKLSMRLGFSIPINVFGPGVSIPHYGPIVINPHVKIGKNCRIHVGTNIGMHKGEAPIIGDNVYIGPGAIIFGDVRIANNVSIGANSTINKSVLEENVVVAGSQSTIVKNNANPWNNGK